MSRPVIFEFFRVGRYVRVSVVDEISGEEVTVVASSRYSREHMKRLVLRKLEYVRRRRMRKA